MKQTRNMLLQRLIPVLCALSFTTVQGTANPFQECHTFTDISGRSIEARVLNFDPANGKVNLQMENGKKGAVHLNQLSPADHHYLELWMEAQHLLNNELLEINITFKDGYWDDTGDTSGDRDRREDQLIISIVNHGKTSLTNITAEYCTYRERKEQTAVFNQPLITGELSPSEPFESTIRQVSYKRGFEFRNILIGARFRFMMPLSDGTLLTREICVPKPLPLDDYPWAEGELAREEEKASLPDPADYPDRHMTEKEIRVLAEQYIEAVEDKDFEAYKALLTPMHPGDPVLTKSTFEQRVDSINSMHILDIEGLCVNMRVRYKRGTQREGWLLINQSGHIKYTPLLFTHPIETALQNVSFLLRNRRDLRQTGVSYLSKTKIPMFSYDTNGKRNDWEDSVEQIMEWIEENGGIHDITEPRVFYPEDALKEQITQAEMRIANVDRQNEYDNL